MLDNLPTGQRTNYLIAIALPKTLQQEIVRWRADHFSFDTGYPIAAQSLVLPLIVMQNLTERQIADFQHLLQDTHLPAFTLRLNDAEYWHTSRQIWLGCRPADRKLLQLASLLRSRAARMGCSLPLSPWHPRVLLWRHVKSGTKLPKIDVSWSIAIEQFSLYSWPEHGRSDRFQLVRHFPLTKG